MIPRPTTLVEIAKRAGSFEDFGRELRDWLHELRRISSRPQVKAIIADEPSILRDRFPDGEVADAWLAAYAEHLAQKSGIAPPPWAFDKNRVAQEPWFANEAGSRTSRILALKRSPLAFKRRNLYTPWVELPLELRAGRPIKSPIEKRQSNAARQRLFRERRKQELTALRNLATV
jgi:hypothetical protein